MRRIKLDTLIFVVFITVFGLLNLLNPDKVKYLYRKTAPLQKNRILFQSVFDKSYASGWNDYYSDTLLLRENLIQANVQIKKNFGIEKNRISISVIGTERLDKDTQTYTDTCGIGFSRSDGNAST